MNLFLYLPEELKNRVLRTNLTSRGTSEDKKLGQILAEFSESEIDVLYENTRPILVLVFQSEIDLLAYRLKYGDNYV